MKKPMLAGLLSLGLSFGAASAQCAYGNCAPLPPGPSAPAPDCPNCVEYPAPISAVDPFDSTDPLIPDNQVTTDSCDGCVDIPTPGPSAPAPDCPNCGEYPAPVSAVDPFDPTDPFVPDAQVPTDSCDGCIPVPTLPVTCPIPGVISQEILNPVGMRGSELIFYAQRLTAQEKWVNATQFWEEAVKTQKLSPTQEQQYAAALIGFAGQAAKYCPDSNNTAGEALNDALKLLGWDNTAVQIGQK